MSARHLLTTCGLVMMTGLLMPVAAYGVEGPATPGTPQSPVSQPSGPQPDPVLQAARSTYKVKDTEVDLSVPESPAFTALGLNPETILRPATAREFATGLLNGVDRRGNLQTGVAFDTVPYLVFVGSGLTLQDYRSSRVARVLSRTSISLATTKGASDDDKSVKLAFGVNAVLWDTEDPRMNNDELLRCFAGIRVFRPTNLQLGDPAALEAERAKFEREELRPQAEACREQFRRTARWNSTSWIVAAAATSVSPTGLAGDLSGGATTVWTSVSYGFDGVPGLERHAQLIGHARRVNDEIVVDAAAAAGEEVRDTTIAGAQFRAGTTSFALALEAAYLRTAVVGGDNDTAMRLTFSAERRLARDVWITVAFGGDQGADAPNTQGLSVLTALKWAFSKEPTLVSHTRPGS